jgi:hypothetical protein
MSKNEMLRSAQHDIYVFLSSIRVQNDVGHHLRARKEEIASPAARNDIKKGTSFDKDDAFSNKRIPMRIIIGISRCARNDKARVRPELNLRAQSN